MNDLNKPPFSEAHLEHVGVKGMRWGKRKSTDESSNSRFSNLSSNQQKAIVAAGATAVGAVLYKTGTLRPTMSMTARTSAKGAGFVLGKTGTLLMNAAGTPYFFLRPLTVETFT